MIAQPAAAARRWALVRQGRRRQRHSPGRDRGRRDLACSRRTAARSARSSSRRFRPGARTGCGSRSRAPSEAVSFDQENPESAVGRKPRPALLRPARPQHPLARGGQAYVTLPGGHPQGFGSCFDAFVAETYAAIAGARPTACRALRGRAARHAGSPRPCCGRRNRAVGGGARPVKLGVPHRLHARALARGDRRARCRPGLRGARAGGLAAPWRPAVHREPRRCRRLDDAEVERVAAALAEHGLDLLGARLLRQQPASRPRRAGGDPRACAGLHRCRSRPRRGPGRDLRRA